MNSDSFGRCSSRIENGTVESYVWVICGFLSVRARRGRLIWLMRRSGLLEATSGQGDDFICVSIWPQGVKIDEDKEV